MRREPFSFRCYFYSLYIITKKTSLLRKWIKVQYCTQAPTWTASSNSAFARSETSFSSNCIPFSSIQAFITSLRSLSSIRPSSVKHELQTKTDCLLVSLGHNQPFGEWRPKHSNNLLEILCVIGELYKIELQERRTGACG